LALSLLHPRSRLRVAAVNLQRRSIVRDGFYTWLHFACFRTFLNSLLDYACDCFWRCLFWAHALAWKSRPRICYVSRWRSKMPTRNHVLINWRRP